MFIFDYLCTSYCEKRDVKQGHRSVTAGFKASQRDLDKASDPSTIIMEWHI